MLRTLPSPDVTTIKNLIYSLSDLFYKYSNIHTQRDFLKITIKYSAVITFITYYSYLFSMRIQWKTGARHRQAISKC